MGLVGSQPSNAALGKSSTTLPGLPHDLAPTVPAATPLPTLAEAHSALNTRLATLHAALPSATALVVINCHGDPLEMARLGAKKANFDRLWKTVKQSEIVGDERWLEEDDRKLVNEVEMCRWGLSFYCVK